MLNLIDDRWIPITRKSGKEDMIAPWEIVDTEDAPISIGFPRSDFEMGVTMFMIALLQTAYAPKDDDEWMDRLESPPSMNELHDVLKEYNGFFNLYGDERRFMQYPDVEYKIEKEISQLILTSASVNAIKLNSDFFSKRSNNPKRLCTNCTAAALIALQYFAKPGGAGIQASAIGSSPIVTIVTGRNVWETSYLNVLTKTKMEEIGGNNTTNTPFSWIETHDNLEMFQAINQASVLWPTPRTVLLARQSHGVCDLCGKTDECTESFFERPKGMKYEGMVFPLSPTIHGSDNKTRYVLATPNIVHFNNWSPIVFEQQSEDIKPAKCVLHVLNNLSDVRELIKQRPNIRVFGYINDKANTNAGVDFTVPTFSGSQDDLIKFYAFVKRVVSHSNSISSLLPKFTIDAVPLFKEKKKKQKEKRVITEKITESYWRVLDSEFRRLLSSFESDDKEQELLDAWHNQCYKAAMNVFDSMTETTPLEKRKDVEVCRNNLQKEIWHLRTW